MDEYTVYVKDNHSWSYAVLGRRVRTLRGLVGGHQRPYTRSLASLQGATAWARAQVDKKIREGYHCLSAPPAAPSGAPSTTVPTIAPSAQPASSSSLAVATQVPTESRALPSTLPAAPAAPVVPRTVTTVAQASPAEAPPAPPRRSARSRRTPVRYTPRAAPAVPTRRSGRVRRAPTRLSVEVSAAPRLTGNKRRASTSIAPANSQRRRQEPQGAAQEETNVQRSTLALRNTHVGDTTAPAPEASADIVEPAAGLSPRSGASAGTKRKATDAMGVEHPSKKQKGPVVQTEQHAAVSLSSPPVVQEQGQHIDVEGHGPSAGATDSIGIHARTRSEQVEEANLGQEQANDGTDVTEEGTTSLDRSSKPVHVSTKPAAVDVENVDGRNVTAVEGDVVDGATPSPKEASGTEPQAASKRHDDGSDLTKEGATGRDMSAERDQVSIEAVVVEVEQVGARNATRTVDDTEASGDKTEGGKVSKVVGGATSSRQEVSVAVGQTGTKRHDGGTDLTDKATGRAASPEPALVSIKPVAVEVHSVDARDSTGVEQAPEATKEKDTEEDKPKEVVGGATSSPDKANVAEPRTGTKRQSDTELVNPPKKQKVSLGSSTEEVGIEAVGATAQQGPSANPSSPKEAGPTPPVLQDISVVGVAGASSVHAVSEGASTAAASVAADTAVDLHGDSTTSPAHGSVAIKNKFALYYMKPAKAMWFNEHIPVPFAHPDPHAGVAGTVAVNAHETEYSSEQISLYILEQKMIVLDVAKGKDETYLLQVIATPSGFVVHQRCGDTGTVGVIEQHTFGGGLIGGDAAYEKYAEMHKKLSGIEFHESFKKWNNDRIYLPFAVKFLRSRREARTTFAEHVRSGVTKWEWRADGGADGDGSGTWSQFSEHGQLVLEELFQDYTANAWASQRCVRTVDGVVDVDFKAMVETLTESSGTKIRRAIKRVSTELEHNLSQESEQYVDPPVRHRFFYKVADDKDVTLIKEVKVGGETKQMYVRLQLLELKTYAGRYRLWERRGMVGESEYKRSWGTTFWVSKKFKKEFEERFEQLTGQEWGTDKKSKLRRTEGYVVNNEMKDKCYMLSDVHWNC